MTQTEKIEKLVSLITSDTRHRYTAEGYDWQNNEAHRINTEAVSKPGKLYTKIDIGHSGKYMVENSTGEIYGIKGYGVIHRGHHYGNLDTIDQYYWGNYTAVKK